MISPSQPVISIEDLHYAYPPLLAGHPAVDILRGVTSQVARGELVALVGRVGAGKTTLCMALNGLAPHVTGGRFRGRVLVAGHDTRREPVASLARWAGLVFQDPEAQLTQMRVEDEIAFGPENLGLPVPEIASRLAWALGAVGLAGYQDRSPLLLSGGEKQRVAIAAMLAMQPAALVLDEPTANLDPVGKVAIFNVLIALARRRGLGVVVATQDLELAARYADRIWALHEGRIALAGPPRAVFSQAARLQEWGIGLPQLAELAALLGQRTGRAFSFPGVGRAYVILKGELDAHRAAASAPDRPPAGDAAGGRPISTPLQPPAGPGNPPGASLLRLQGIAYAYPDGTRALQGLDLSIAPGEFVALLGPNGSGKTTLAKLLIGLLRPDQGQVFVAGRDTRVARVPELARTVGYVFQNPDHQIFAPTVAEEVAFALRLQGLRPPDVARRVADALAQFGLSGQAHLPPALLGLGQRRQVALAAVLAAKPRMLLLDEPTGGLDSRSLQELMSAVAAFNRQGGAVLLITHDMRLVAEYAGRAVVMSAGRVLFDGAPRALFAQRGVLSAARLAVPPVVRLAQRLAPHGFAPALTNAELAAAWHARVRAAPAPPPATPEAHHAG